MLSMDVGSGVLADKLPRLRSRPLILTIGTTEPLAAAGLHLDLLLADRLEVRPVALVAGVSAQNGQGVFCTQPIDAELIALQCEALAAVPFRAVRIGAVPSVAGIRIIAAWLRQRGLPLIIDPIMSTSAGGQILDDEMIDVLVKELFPLATCVTPNLREAQKLSGYSIQSVAEMDAAALAIGALGARGVLIKGGHLVGQAIDVFWDNERAWHFEAPRLATDMRGTGCALAMTMTAALAHGQSLRQAIRGGREVVRLLMQTSRELLDQRVVA